MPNTNELGLYYPSGAVGVAPDVPGDMLKLGQSVEAASRRRCTLELSGATASVPANTATNIPFNTVTSDPLGMSVNDGFRVKAIWNGRYRFGVRAALNGGDIAATAKVSMDAVLGDGTVVGMVGQFGMPSDTPMQFFDEVTLAANATIGFRIFWQGTGTRQFTTSAVQYRPRCFIQYLGAA